jgi:transcriptional regulator with XRE-family HTH domain
VQGNDASQPKLITPGQIRAARGLLRWTQVALAKAAQISVPVVKDIEREARQVRPSTLLAIEAAFGRAGLVFLEEAQASPGGGRGVRFRE